MNTNINKQFYIIHTYINKFSEYFLYFLIQIFIFLLLFIMMLNSYLFCGDISHGKGSYLLIMHSSLAITSKLLWYFFMIITIFLFYIYIKKAFSYKYLILSIYTYVNISYYGFIHSTLFLLTGIVWGDYSWGFSITIEYKFISLVAINFMYLYVSCLYLIIAKYSEYTMHYVNILKVVYVFTVGTVLYEPLLNYITLKLTGVNTLSKYEMHQSDESLHFFLISISGYYVSLIFLYIIYLSCILIYSIIHFSMIFTYAIDHTIFIFYDKNILYFKNKILFNKNIYLNV